MYYKTCEICGLKAGRTNNKKRMFMAKFPLHEERCKQWVKIVGKEDLAYIPIEKLHTLKHVCGKHFRKNDFKKKMTQLKRIAIPSLELTAAPLKDEVLFGFPFHVTKHTSDQFNIPNQILVDHNYCNSEPVTEKKKQCCPSPSTSCGENKTIKTTQKRKIVSIDQGPSTSSWENKIIKTTQQRKKICINQASDQHNQILLDHNYCISESITEKERPCSPSKCSTVETDVAEATVPCHDTNKVTTPRKRRLLKRIEKYKTANKTLKKKLITMDNISSPILNSLIDSTIKNQNRKAHGKRWTKLNKSVALAIYKKSPKSYRYLSQLLPMPSIRTLQTVLQNMKLETGIDKTVMENLKNKGDKLTEKEKICAILFDEMALKKRLIYSPSTDSIDGFEDLGNEGGRSERIADHVLVFMLQGIYKKIKQPIAYYFVKGTIATEKLAFIIEAIIRAVTAAGYKILTTVCDQGPTNVGALNLLKKRCNKPPECNHFMLDGEMVYIIFDVPHLFKSIRNNFLQAGEIEFNNKKAKWSHLVQVEEKNRMRLRFTKLTKLHVAPKYRSKMRVKLAAQILSNTVAAILKLMSESIQNKEQSNAMLQTAEVVEALDRLFDSTNGPSSKNDVKKNIRTNVSKNSFHHKLWPKYQQMLKTLIFLKSDSQIRLRNIRCVNGYITTIASLQDIWKYVSTKKFKYLNLRQLNQDAIENLFGIIRQHSPTNRNPTCHHFKGALKSSILTRLSTPLSKGGNCEKDENEVLFDFQDLVFPKKNSPSTSYTEKNNYFIEEPTPYNNIPVLSIPDNEFNCQQRTEAQLEEIKNFFKSFEMQPTVYVSGYIAHDLLKKNKCENCSNSLAVSNVVQNSIYNYIALKEWWKEKQSLTYPSIELCESIDKATKLFEKEVLPCLHRNQICTFSKTLIISTIDFTWICENHRNSLVDELTQRLSLLLLRNECKNRNRSFALSEEPFGDTLKKAEQQGIAK